MGVKAGVWIGTKVGVGGTAVSSAKTSGVAVADEAEVGTAVGVGTSLAQPNKPSTSTQKTIGRKCKIIGPFYGGNAQQGPLFTVYLSLCAFF